jgi:hypothetical protein
VITAYIGCRTYAPILSRSVEPFSRGGKAITKVSHGSMLTFYSDDSNHTSKILPMALLAYRFILPPCAVAGALLVLIAGESADRPGVISASARGTGFAQPMVDQASTRESDLHNDASLAIAPVPAGSSPQVGTLIQSVDTLRRQFDQQQARQVALQGQVMALQQQITALGQQPTERQQQWLPESDQGPHERQTAKAAGARKQTQDVRSLRQRKAVKASFTQTFRGP